MTRIAPKTNCAEITNPNMNVDKTVDTTIAIEVAKPGSVLIDSVRVKTTFYDVVCIFYHNSNQQSAKCLIHNHRIR